MKELCSVDADICSVDANELLLGDKNTNAL